MVFTECAVESIPVYLGDEGQQINTGCKMHTIFTALNIVHLT